jgi:hypothetical protein
MKRKRKIPVLKDNDDVFVFPDIDAINRLAEVPPTWPLQRDATAFYGNPYQVGWYEANMTHVVCPWPLVIGTTPLRNIAIHNKCAASLTRVLNTVWDQVGHDVDKIKALHYDQYDGSYNFRNKRGGASLSMHAYGAAIDWDAADNAQHDVHHLFTDNSPLVVAFKAEGWIWGGDWSVNSIDSMHTQAARVHA